jgi:hypothetical protein
MSDLASVPRWYPGRSGGELPLAVRIAEGCSDELTSVSADGIRAALQARAPELALRYAMARTGWYRLGGVVDADYGFVARHIGEWAEEQADGDLERLMEKCAQIGGFVTRLEGCTHYLTAITGERASDYRQIELEQVREVIEGPLWDPDWMPDDLAELIDPLDFPRLDPEPVGPPRLLFRRLVGVGELIAAQDVGKNVK